MKKDAKKTLRHLSVSSLVTFILIADDKDTRGTEMEDALTKYGVMWLVNLKQ